MSQKYDKIAKTLEYLIHKHFLFKTMTQMPRFHGETAELQAQPSAIKFDDYATYKLILTCGATAFWNWGMGISPPKIETFKCPGGGMMLRLQIDRCIIGYKQCMQTKELTKFQFISYSMCFDLTSR